MTWLSYAMDIGLILVTILIHLSPVIGVSTWLFIKQRRWKQGLPQRTPAASRPTRTVEMLALAFVCSAAMVMIDAMVFGHASSVYHASASLIADYWRFASVVIAVVTAALVVAWFRFLKTAVVLVFFGLATLTVVSETYSFLSIRDYAEEYLDVPIPMTIEMQGGIKGVEVAINGVTLGRTPIETTLDEVLEKIGKPRRDDDGTVVIDWDEDLSGKLSTYHGEHHVHLSTAKSTGYNDWNDATTMHIARLTLNGQRVLGIRHALVTNGSRSYGRIQPCRVTFQGMLPEWDAEAKLLLDRARLADYKVDGDWFAAASSYHEFVLDFVRSRGYREPEFDQLLDDWAYWEYGLDGVSNSEDALQVFDRIASEADEAGTYLTQSQAGRALEQLLPLIDADSLIDRAISRLDVFDRWPVVNESHSKGLPQDTYFRINSPSVFTHQKAVRPSDGVLAHAIWRLDARLDSRDDRVDHRIESEITPRLLRLGFQKQIPQDLASILGGRVWQTFHERKTRTRPSLLNNNDNPRPISEGPVRLDARLYRGARAAEGGAHFRTEHRDELIAMARDALDQTGKISSSSLPTWMQFLFRPVESGPLLATQFWPEFDRDVQAYGSYALSLRFAYLAGMQFESTPKQFVDVYLKHGSRGLSNSARDNLRGLKPELRGTVLTALAETVIKLQNEPNDDTDPDQLERTLDKLLDELEGLPVVSAQSQMLSLTARERPGRKKQLILRLRNTIRNEDPMHAELDALTESGDPEYQHLVFDAIRKRPTPRRRALLELLLTAEDASVRDAAKKVSDQLDEIARQPLPSTDVFENSTGRKSSVR